MTEHILHATKVCVQTPTLPTAAPSIGGAKSGFVVDETKSKISILTESGAARRNFLIESLADNATGETSIREYCMDAVARASAGEAVAIFTAVVKGGKKSSVK
ncbi:hypothetical protein HDU81_004656 [Chytriomyces hyalinus]|nr:hypothetical protein HDU81_004656 [Chytriomyces hyalinus]